MFGDEFADAVEYAAGYTVLVDARKRLPASGVAFAADLIITADHAVEREENIRVGLADGSLHPAALAGRDPSSDLALLRLEKPLLQPARRAEKEGRVGQMAVTVARPTLESVQAGLAMISAAGGPVRTMRGGLLRQYFRLDATAYPGYSGGALVDLSGGVLGINTSGLGGGVFLAIPAAVAWETAALLAQHGRIRRGYLGVRSQPVEIPESLRPLLQREQTHALLLVAVDGATPAAEAGLMVGDLLTAIAGQPVADADDLVAALSAGRVSVPTAVEILRGGSRLEVTVSIGER